MSKAAARDWWEQQHAAQERRIQLEEETCLLWYAACKRKTNYPHHDFFDQAGYPEVAALIREAYSKLEEAHNKLEQMTKSC